MRRRRLRKRTRPRLAKKPKRPINGAKAELRAFLNNPDAVIEFPAAQSPRISIILVLFNKAGLTFRCLKSIQQYGDVPYEIILMNNKSNDETTALLGRLRNVVIHENEDNVGFLQASNQGAQLAKGDWLLFLNNDTQMTPCVLSHLLRTAETYPGCGAVGGKLVHPDGKLQEAGSIIWKDGTCHGYGRGDNPNKPEFTYVKEVHYCSGALLLVNKHIFQQAGMFDERYAPAYYEEVDLCMKIRNLGFKVIYQPAAVLIHHEFGSSSSAAAQELMAKQRVKFFEKWQHQLASFPVSAPGNAIYGREYNRGKFRILVIDDRIPDPKLGTGYPRTYSILNHLVELDFQVTYYPLLNAKRTEPCTGILQQKGIEVIYSLADEALDFPRFFTERKALYDAVWVSRPHNMALVGDIIKSVNRDQAVVYDAEALFAMREILRLEVQGQEVDGHVKHRMIRKEVELMEKADTVITVSENERKVIRLYMNKPVEVLGHTVENRATPKPFEQRNGILFVGGFLSEPSPNADAMYYFVNDIFPKIAPVPGAKLWIVGVNQIEGVRQLASEHIIVTGRVENLWDFYNNCRVFITPARFAAGIPLKMLESLSYGLPAVVTPLIAEQLGLQEDTVLIGQNPEEFADKLIQCYTDANVWHQLRNNGLAYIQEECSHKTYRDKLQNLKRLRR